jgi:hypothetical protein
MVAIYSQELHSAVAAVKIKKDAILSRNIQLMCWEFQFLSYQSEGKMNIGCLLCCWWLHQLDGFNNEKMAIECCKHVDGGRAISKSKMPSRI